jgi:MraZ protein
VATWARGGTRSANGRACVQRAGVSLNVELEHLFTGSALNAVDAKGRLSVPAFIRQVIERRSDAKAIIMGAHEVDPCLTAFDRNFARNLFLENERRRLAEEGADPQAHFSRARRTFGITEEVPYDTSGRIILPPMMRRKVQIEDLALFVGTGGTFEIWNPRLALQSGDADLKELAAYRLEERGVAP